MQTIVHLAAKHSSAAIIGVILGATIMCGAGRFPILVEVNWGTDESRIMFDSRTERWCKVEQSSI